MNTLLATRVFIASAIMAFVGLGSYMLQNQPPETAMAITPDQTSVQTGSTFTVAVTVNAATPVNVFSGEIQFDPQFLSVAAIDYNNSLADIWATKPWYENGAGTINFTGGTTKPGAFIGEDTLLTITFRSTAPGVSTVFVESAQILKHDGYGSDTTVALGEALLTVVENPATIPEATITKRSTQVIVGATENPLDLSGDGTYNITDVSIFFEHLIKGNLRSDFNQDGAVSLSDLSILLEAL